MPEGLGAALVDGLGAAVVVGSGFNMVLRSWDIIVFHHFCMSSALAVTFPPVTLDNR